MRIVTEGELRGVSPIRASDECEDDNVLWARASGTCEHHGCRNPDVRGHASDDADARLFAYHYHEGHLFIGGLTSDMILRPVMRPYVYIPKIRRASSG